MNDELVEQVDAGVESQSEADACRSFLAPAILAPVPGIC